MTVQTPDLFMLDNASAFNFAADLLEPESYSPRLEAYWYDPVGFIEDFFPTFKWTRYQKEIVANLVKKEKLCIRGPHGLGKTALVALVVLWFALTRDDMCRAQGGDWKVITTASVERQLTKYLWPEIRKWARPRGINWEALGREPFDRRSELLFTQLKLEYGEAFAANSDDPANIEGAHADHLLYVVDEGKSVIPETFDAIEGAFSGASAVQTDFVDESVGGSEQTGVRDDNPGRLDLEASEDVKGITPPERGPLEAEEDRNNEPTAAREAYALVISTPGEPAGRFYEIQSRRPGYEDWWVRFVTLEEAIAAGRVSREWAKKRARQWGEQSAIYQNRVLGQFAVDALDGVIPIAWAEAAMLRGSGGNSGGVLVEPEVPSDRGGAFARGLDIFKGRLSAVACDVARSGVDKTTIALRCRQTCLPLVSFHGADTMQTTGEILSALDIYGTRVSAYACVDVIGIGAGVVDRLRELGIDVEAFNASTGSVFTDASGEIEFLNRRAAAWWGLREMLDPAGHENREARGVDEVILPYDEELLGDLCTPRYKRTSAGKIAVEEKDQIRKRLGRSPDRGDAVVMAFADRMDHREGEVIIYDEPVFISPY